MPTAQKVRTMPARQKPRTEQGERLTAEVIGAIRDLLNAIEEMERGNREAAWEYIGEAKGKLPKNNGGGVTGGGEI